VESRRYVLGGYAVWVAALIAVYYGLPGVRVVPWGLISLTGVTAVVAGVVLNRPARKTPWLLLAGTLTCFAAGQLSFLIAAKLDVRLPFPSFADLLYLSCYPLYAAALLIFIYWRTPDGDRRSLIDALTLTAGLALLSWTFLIRPYVHNPELSGMQKGVAIGYPLGDVLMLALLARLLAPGTGRTRSVQLLAFGTVACLVSDVAYGVEQLYGKFSEGSLIDLGWAIFYAALGASALHPTMVRLTVPVSRQRVEVSRPRLAVLMLASLMAPVVLIAALPDHATLDLAVIAVFSAVLNLLVLARLWDAATSNRRALGRERALRQASLSLVAADEVTQVAATVTETVAALLGRRATGDALLGLRIDGVLRAIPAGDVQTWPVPVLSPQADAWLAKVTEPAPVLRPMEMLPEQARRARPSAEWALLCPLTIKDTHTDAPIGMIVAFGEQRTLADLSATLEILAHQVALTVGGITLRQSAIRQRNEAYFRILVQDATDAIVIVADDGTVKYATPSTSAIFGDIAVEGELFWDLVSMRQREEFARTFEELRERARLGPRLVDERIIRRDGKSVHIQARCSDLRGEPNIGGLVFTLRDVTEQHLLEEELTHRAFHDALTGLPNRVLFQDRIAHQLATSRRTGTVVGVLFVDLDDFKVVNDTKGHSVGDELLVAAAGRLATVSRSGDTAARLGGDEFALLIVDDADVIAMEAAAERVVKAFSEPFALAGGLVTCSASVGVATTHDAADTDQLLRHADLALYAAKGAGKRQWRRYQPVLSAGLLRRRELQEALEEAVAESAFRLVYQPIVALDSGELAGFEALIRWPHPRWGMMLPDQFITLAEETGQIIEVGAWVLDRATADLADWRRSMAVPAARATAEAGDRRPGNRHDLYVSVNVSARQFDDPGFADTVRQVLRSSGIESHALMLELTESALLRRDERLHAELAELKGIGVKLAIDDFGTGYSSLSYLRELPIDVVKVDKAFVDGIAESAQRRALAEGIIQIARTLHLAVVAEGIETEVQRDLLISMGCPYGQGYLLAKPLAASEAGRLAREGFTAPPFVPASRRSAQA
jgi:diguanylate cyclase (GGDEF)-like protein/PAS domain S-box-containing protein